MIRPSLNPQWPTYLASLCAFIAFISGFGRYFLLDHADGKHCHALEMSGQWLDRHFANWQPEGCMMQRYQSKEAALCFSSRPVIFIGDSTVRKLFYQFSNLVDSSLPASPPDDGTKHSDCHFHTTFGNKLSFHWDPFLNTSSTNFILSDSRVYERPALLVIGGGLWYLRHSDNSGGLPAWEVNTESIIAKVAQNRPSDEVVILPVQEVDPESLSDERAKSMRLADIDAMNSDLFHRVYPDSGLFSSRSPVRDIPPLSLPFVFNRMLDPSQTQDGLHYSDTIVRTQANILLNHRCNDALPKDFPFDKTCCSNYPWPGLTHVVILFLLISLGPALWVGHRQTKQRMLTPPYYTSEEVPWLVLSATVLLLYIADRSSFWLKEQKQFSPWSFAFFNLLALGAGLATIRKADKDLGFLNRDQTDEWKGWMQIAILIYHYFGASKISGIYNPIRVLVAAYLFQTGYGHTTFYLKKADFGGVRVAQVLIRLNLLTVVLAYSMNANYLFYYFAPLCSFWYLVIYLTLIIGHGFNDHLPFILGKICASAGLVAWLLKAKWPMSRLFQWLYTVFGIQWSAREWSFRVELDMWIVYVGMLAAISYIKIREFRLTNHARWPVVQKVSIGLSLLVLVWFMAFEVGQKDKFTYNGWHPYVSLLPILAFVILRNASSTLRSASSRIFISIGKCSLETFIIQYHFWLAGDTKGILQIIPGTNWRPLNSVLTSILFIYLSHHVGLATGSITQWFCGRGPPKTLPLPSTAVGDTGDGSGHPEKIPSSSGSEAPLATPRWLKRLGFGPGSQDAQPVQHGSLLGTKLLGVVGVMWVMNLLWTG